jgi:hypothetical protein
MTNEVFMNELEALQWIQEITHQIKRLKSDIGQTNWEYFTEKANKILDQALEKYNLHFKLKELILNNNIAISDVIYISKLDQKLQELIVNNWDSISIEQYQLILEKSKLL